MVAIGIQYLQTHIASGITCPDGMLFPYILIEGAPNIFGVFTIIRSYSASSGSCYKSSSRIYLAMRRIVITMMKMMIIIMMKIVLTGCLRWNQD